MIVKKTNVWWIGYSIIHQTQYKKNGKGKVVKAIKV